MKKKPSRGVLTSYSPDQNDIFLHPEQGNGEEFIDSFIPLGGTPKMPNAGRVTQEEPVIRFSQLLSSEMKSKKLGARDLEAVLKRDGVDTITEKRISEYLLEITTPPFPKARQMMQALSSEISDDDLKQALEANRQHIRTLRMEDAGGKYGGYGKRVRVNIRLRKISSRIPIDRAEADNVVEGIISNRVIELYGKYELSRYIEQLIASDIKDKIDEYLKTNGGTES